MYRSSTLYLSKNLNSSSRRLISTFQRRQGIIRHRQHMPRSITKKNAQSSTAVPLTLLNKVFTNSNEISRPSSQQLKALFVASAIPMVAFGFMDNLIMIQAGGYIDATFGAALGLATLSAAALGQVVSDVSGVAFGGVVERTFERFSMTKTPSLTNVQRTLPLVRNVRIMGSIVGVAVGCLLGATSLLFMDLEARERQERTAELNDIITKMMLASFEDDGLQCEECRIHLTPASRKKFDPSSLSSPNNNTFNDMSSSSCTLSVQELKLFDQNNDDNNPFLSSEQLCARDGICVSKKNRFYVPIVMDKKNTVVSGVLEFRTDTISEFTIDDKRTAQILARHIGIFMERIVQQQ
eukprot:CAMPEP_0194151640 /NCGR_PEP_ID=MMETSP0152-20130528/49109_1 /TAXON_ID=1049557 /ORGANISM="Thalassiothrix antarctica, Strain L6-D1" /LENGTH=351 /DNA_ID=CAMNT_0038855617 /DNA_START=30 /DNA_END=1085 /DNA_ORIENTATION=+